jgi:hypothetical protein
MIIYKDDKKIIQCDKCGLWSKGRHEIADDKFYREGWSLNPNAKKYKHTCFNCNTIKKRKSKL